MPTLFICNIFPQKDVIKVDFQNMSQSLRGYHSQNWKIQIVVFIDFQIFQRNHLISSENLLYLKKYYEKLPKLLDFFNSFQNRQKLTFEIQQTIRLKNKNQTYKEKLLEKLTLHSYYSQMTESLYAEDRPINPNKQYLQQKQQQYKQKKQIHDYLKKHQPLQQVLPCFRDNLTHLKQKKEKQNKKHQKSKAEIYEEIKKKNLQKFGQKKSQQKQPEVKKKKINPSKITVQYKPKDSVFINTNQYKLKEHKDQNQQPVNQSRQKAIQKSGNNFTLKSQKQKYQKLLQILHKEKSQLTQEKQNFEKHKQKLEFKKLIEKQESVPFLNEIKKQIEEKRKSQQSHRAKCKQAKQNGQQIEESNISKAKKSRNKQIIKQKIVTKSLNEIKSKINQLQQQKQEIEDDVYRNKRQIIDPSDVIDTKYSIHKINQIPSFDIESFKEFIDLRTLNPQGNQFYKIAKEVFQTGLSVKQAKMKMKMGDLDLMKQSDKNEINSANYKRKFENGIRMTKYNNGWVEVWTPGVQRLMGNKQLEYKVIWLRNGDIKQEWKNKKLTLYYSKEKQVVQIQFDKFQPIYFFIQLNQLQQYDTVKRTKTVMFRQGRIEAIDLDQHDYNGFSL